MRGPSALRRAAACAKQVVLRNSPPYYYIPIARNLSTVSLLLPPSFPPLSQEGGRLLRLHLVFSFGKSQVPTAVKGLSVAVSKCNPKEPPNPPRGALIPPIPPKGGLFFPLHPPKGPEHLVAFFVEKKVAEAR